MIRVSITGLDIYETLEMPVAPRKGDRLWLRSLCGRSDLPSDVIVSKVEWVRDQTARFTDRENAGIYPRLTVRRVRPDDETPVTGEGGL